MSSKLFTNGSIGLSFISSEQSKNISSLQVNANIGNKNLTHVPEFPK